MKGCPHCTNLKNNLKENNIKFIERDVDKNEKEYENFVRITESEYLPSFVLLNLSEKTLERMVPDKNFDTIEEATEKIKKFIL